MDVAYTTSPIGTLEVRGVDGCITHVNYVNDRGTEQALSIPSYIENCINQLGQYFQGRLINFDVEVALRGTSFQNNVWNALCSIPYGEQASYKKIANDVSCPNGFRAVGQANNRNPISIIIPCHRVVASNGTLTGYAGGLWRKEWLLELEKKKH